MSTLHREEIYAEFRELEFRHGPVENARRRELWRMLERLDRNGERPALSAPCEPPTGRPEPPGPVTPTQAPPNGESVTTVYSLDPGDRPRRCLSCGSELNGRRAHAQTCSPACRQALRRGQLALDLEEKPAA